MELVPVEAEGRRPRGWRVVRDDIRGLEDRAKRLATVLRLEIELDRALAPVQRQEEPPHTRRQRHRLAVRIAAGWLDLDHVGAELRQQRAGKRRGDVLRHLDHANPP